MRKLYFYEAIATLVGCTIGAGILGIPYVVAKSGFLIGFIDIVLIGLAVMLINLYLGEVVLRTNGNHQLTGYAELYLGKKGKFLMIISMLIGIYGALIAYLIGVGEALHAIFGLNAFTFSLLFFAFVTTIIYFGLKIMKRIELFFSFFVIFILLLIVVFSFSHINLDNLTGVNFNNLMLPYGVILFAFLGAAAIPELKEELNKHRKYMKRAIIIGGLIPLVLYALFSFVVVGVTGLNTSEIATIGLGENLGKLAILFGNLFAVFAMSTSFLVLGIALKEVYMYDYDINKNISWFLVCFVPLLIFILGIRSFISTLGYAGAIAGGLDGVLIVLMAWKAKETGKRKPEYNIVKGRFLGFVLMLVFVLGIIYQLFVI